MVDGTNLAAERDLIRYLCPYLDTDELSEVEVLLILAEIGAWDPGSFGRNLPAANSGASRETVNADSRAKS